MAPQIAIAKIHSADISKTLTMGSVQRAYTLHIPRNITNNAPVVFIFHGFLANKNYVAWDTRISKYADERGFIAVYPQGVGLSWNAGNCCGKAARSQVDDIAFIRRIVEDLKDDYKINNHMIFATGFSNGGMLCYRIAQELPDLFAAVASVEGSLRSSSITPNEPINVLIIHGMRDKVFPLDGGTGHWLGYKVQTISAQDTARYWANSDGCSPEPLIEKNTAFEKQTYSGGKNSTTVCLYKVVSNGHVWPGGRESRLFHKFHPSPIVASPIILDFFLQHPKTTL